MHQLERDGDRAARRVNRLLADQETMIGAVLLGNNLINILASALATEVHHPGDPRRPGAWPSPPRVMTVLVLVFAEVLPKTLAIVRSDDVARFLSAPTLVVVRLFGPIIYTIQWIVRADAAPVRRRARHGDRRAGRPRGDPRRGRVPPLRRPGGEPRPRMLGGVLDLAEMDVGEVMVHRKAIAMLDADLPPRELVAEALASGHTRLPLYRDEPENIVGVLHAKDLLQAMADADGRIEALDIAAIVREPWFIPETTNLKDQLNAFLKRRTHFALVVDEYGALQGLVTLEDILEEIVGEIEDEHDVAVPGRAPPARRLGARSTAR